MGYEFTGACRIRYSQCDKIKSEKSSMDCKLRLQGWKCGIRIGVLPSDNRPWKGIHKGL